MSLVKTFAPRRPFATQTESKDGKRAVAATSRFNSEAHLVQAFTEFVRAENVLYAAHEIDCAHGVADIVLFERNERANSNANVQYLSPQWAYGLTLVPYRKIFSTWDFSDLTHLSQRAARNVLAGFVDAGFVRRSSRCADEWIKFRQPQPIARELIAVEAKLKDWRRAAYQAARYQHFAHFSWVLLDTARAAPAVGNIDHFLNRNLGLALFDSENGLQIICRPRKQAPRSPNKFWKANVTLASAMFS